MADNKDSSKRKKSKERRKAKKPERTERRFAPQRSNGAMLTMGGSILGGLAIGAGAYGQWLADHRLAASPYIVAGGAVVLAGVILWGDMEGSAVRVGDAGVAVEKGGKVTTRIAWCDMKSIELQDGRVRIDAEPTGCSISVAANPLAAAWVIKEAEDRVPNRLKAAKSDRESLPKTARTDGERVDVEAQQITGRACRASDRVITFERDARQCSRCGEVYHKDSLPETCLTCDADLTGLEAG